MAKGTVKFFNETKGFGFIKPDDSEVDLFFHVSMVLGDEVLQEDDKVEYTEGESDKGPHAESVQKIEADAQGELKMAA